MRTDATDFLRLHTPGNQIAFEEFFLEDEEPEPEPKRGVQNLAKTPNRPSAASFDEDFDPRRKDQGYPKANKPHVPSQLGRTATKAPSATPSNNAKNTPMRPIATEGNDSLDEFMSHSANPDQYSSGDQRQKQRQRQVQSQAPTEMEPDEDGFVRFRPYQKSIPRHHLLFLHSCSYLMTYPWTFILSLSLTRIWGGSLYPILIIEGLCKIVTHILLDHCTFLLRRMVLVNAIALGILVTSLSNSIGVLLVWEMLKIDSIHLKLTLTACVAIMRCLGHGWGILQLRGVRALEDQLPVAEQVGLKKQQDSIDDWIPVSIPIVFGLASKVGDSAYLTGILLAGLFVGLLQLYLVHGAYDDLWLWSSDDASENRLNADKTSEDGDYGITEALSSETWLECGQESGLGLKDATGLVNGYWRPSPNYNDAEAEAGDAGVSGTGDRQYVMLAGIGFFMVISFVESRQAVMMARLCSEGIDGAIIGLLASVGAGSRVFGGRAYQGMIENGSADRQFATTAFLLGTLVFQFSVGTAHLINPKDDLLLLLGLIPLGFSLGGTCGSIQAYLSLIHPRVHARCFLRIHTFLTRLSLIFSLLLPLLLTLATSFSTALFVSLSMQTFAAAFYLYWMSWAPHACTA